jgi:hypothetical protein
MKTNSLIPLFIEGPGFLGGFFLMLVFILVLLTIFGIFYLYYTSKTKERLALIEKGMDPNLANSDFLTQVLIIGGGFALGLIGGDLLPGKYGYGPLTGIISAAVCIVVYTVLKRKKAMKNDLKSNQKPPLDD